MDFLTVAVMREAGFRGVTISRAVKTAGYSLPRWWSERMALPMTYVPQKAQRDYGRPQRPDRG